MSRTAGFAKWLATSRDIWGAKWTIGERLRRRRRAARPGGGVRPRGCYCAAVDWGVTEMGVVTFPCVVCGCHVFHEPPGSYEICPVCGWEDDNVQARHPRMRTEREGFLALLAEGFTESAQEQLRIPVGRLANLCRWFTLRRRSAPPASPPIGRARWLGARRAPRGRLRADSARRQPALGPRKPQRSA